MFSLNTQLSEREQDALVTRFQALSAARPCHSGSATVPLQFARTSRSSIQRTSFCTTTELRLLPMWSLRLSVRVYSSSQNPRERSHCTFTRSRTTGHRSWLRGVAFLQTSRRQLKMGMKGFARSGLSSPRNSGLQTWIGKLSYSRLDMRLTLFENENKYF